MPETVVSDITPIINLIKIDRLDILEKLYGTIFIPLLVYNEFEEGKKKEFYLNLKRVEWIQIVELKNKNIPDFIIDLEGGEAETVALAKELKADLVLLDEK
jgi:predicted nucleic acid-binding protein